MRRSFLPAYEVGARVEYRHRGQVFIGFFVKAQRRAAVLEDARGRALTVPWAAVIGPADGKKQAHHGG